MADANLEFKRRLAIRRLWTHAVSQLRFRYPDPRANVEARVIQFNCALPDRPSTIELGIKFEIRGLRESSDPDRVLLGGLDHNAVFGWQWPGVSVAQAYATSSWAILMAHEALEMTTFRESWWEPGVRAVGPFTPRPSRIPHAFDNEFEVIHDRYRERQVVAAHAADSEHQRMLCWPHTGDLARVADYVLGLGKTAELLWRDGERARRELENEMDAWEPGT